MKKNTDKKEKEKKSSCERVRGLRISFACGGMMILILWCLIMNIYSVIAVDSGYSKIIKTNEAYVNARQEAYNYKSYTMELTWSAQQFVVSQEEGCLTAYFQVVEENELEEAANGMKGYLKNYDTEAIEAIDSARTTVRELEETQIHAMALVLSQDECQIPRENWPQKLLEYSLPDSEYLMTDQEKMDMAYELLYGEDYKQKTEVLRNQMDLTIDTINEELDQLSQKEKGDVGGVVAAQKRHLTLMFIGCLVFGLMVIFLIVLPMRKMIQQIKNGELVDQKGSFELRYLAKIYNEMTLNTAIDMDFMTRKAEHDALTGIMNRAAFNELTEMLSTDLNPEVLIMMDVDHFKTVNDTYGHEMGDQVLKRVAETLVASFRAEDYCIRLGGDEFVVILKNVTPLEKHIIRTKLDHINEVLMESVDQIPAVSISAGVAFSQHGYSEELFAHADEALYATKENGRCGYSFFGNNIKYGVKTKNS